MDEEHGTTHWKRNLWVCVFGSFTTIVAMTLLLPFLPLYVEQLGVTDDAAIVQWSGVAYGATFLTAAMFAPLWGRLGDQYGRKLMLIRASLGMAVAMSLIGLSQNVYQLVGLRLLAGLLGGYSSGSTVLVATQTPRAQTGWALGMHVLRHHGRQPRRPADRRRAAATDRHPDDVPCGRRDHLRRVPGNHVPDQGRAAPARRATSSAQAGGRAFPTKRPVVAMLVTGMLLMLATCRSSRSSPSMSRQSFPTSAG